uniref:Uncharacterized protein n=2 Tax=Cucumis sativus TaxID=3659 RepID=A0A0A0K279_CUCSA
MSSFISKFGSCWRSAAVAPHDAVTDEVKAEQGVTSPRSSKSESAAHWRPALAAIVEDSNGAEWRCKKSSKRKAEKKTSGHQGSFTTKSYGYYDGRDNYW